MPPAANCKVFPAETVTGAVIAPDWRKFPEVKASNNETCVIVDDGSPVKDTVAVLAAVALDGAPKVTCWRAYDPPDNSEAPVEPGSAVWSEAYRTAGPVYAVARTSALISAFASAVAIPGIALDSTH